MLNKKIEQAINEQINAEIYSAYLYASMEMYLESIDMAGAAVWMRAQVQEEMAHAEKFMRYVNDRGGRVILTAIETPPTEWTSVQEVFESALAHEQKVTSLINTLVALARTENDYMSENFLQWYVAEQVEEEASVGEVVRKFKLVGESGGGIFMIDRELSTRVFTPPAAE